ncbi:MAG: glycosidase [Proteobacteria bacterium]|nr:MAG: glycosidase [Pseudomonadota bacterium]
MRSTNTLRIPPQPIVAPMFAPRLAGSALVKRLSIKIESDDRRVIVRPFILGPDRVASLFKRINDLDDARVDETLAHVRQLYEQRHDDLLATFTEHYDAGAALIGWDGQWSLPRRLLAGSYLTMEYAIDSAALFNPSIVPHPDQRGVAEGALRIVMSLRATGEGHVSSIVFHTGTITAAGDFHLDPPAKQLTRARIALPRLYEKEEFEHRLTQMRIPEYVVDRVLGELSDPFDLPQLHGTINALKQGGQVSGDNVRAMESIERIASCNYRIRLDDQDQLNELVIFPLGPEESRGIEDLRLVEFTEDDGSKTYLGTYTAYDGFRITPMMIKTPDFKTFEVFSMNGASAMNKGMALFPRKINGHYVVCSRIDGENLFIGKSDTLYRWDDVTKLTQPEMPWEFVQLGNCGSPIETEHGWLLLTHGVGPMRSYSIGAMLLDLDDPTKIIGHMKEPLLVPDEHEREGYVPNVVYTCGLQLHGGKLYIPYAQADKSTGLAVVTLDELLEHFDLP